MTDIEGKAERVDEEPRRELVRRQEGAVQTFNPLDSEPVQFKRQLQSRQENYDALAMHLRGMLVPDKDFGRIHVVNKQKCPRPWECSPEATPGHWSGYQLLASGADKILGILGLGVAYPGEQDFIRAALTGKQILDVIMKCHVVDHRERTISEGMGACGRDEVNGSLNNAIKRSCKRARVDAVQRLPAISALFEADFLAEIAEASARRRGGNTVSGRGRQMSQKFNTGAHLEVMPIGKKLKGQRFEDMDDGAIDWILRTMTDKPDIFDAAKREHERRYPSTPLDPIEGKDPAENPGKNPGKTPPAAEQTTADWFDDYEAFAASMEQNQ